MDEDTAIINTNTRNQKIKNFFISNKKNIIIFVSIIIFIFFGYFAYDEVKKRNKAKLADQYSYLTINFLTGNKTNIGKELIKIVESKDKTYSPLALYFLLDNNIIVKEEKINKLFDILINDTNLENEIKNLIIYKKALYNSDFETESNLLKILNPIINSESMWKSHALFLMAEYFFSKGEKQKSKGFFEQIIDLKDANSHIKLKAQKRIRSDFNK
tara:strand:- start:89 stop:733 length:645 start_codon:yes stop_codon:yes gene_type:complete